MSLKTYAGSQRDSTVRPTFSAKSPSTTRSIDTNIIESIETHDQTPAATDLLKPSDVFHKIVFGKRVQINLQAPTSPGKGTTMVTCLLTHLGMN